MFHVITVNNHVYRQLLIEMIDTALDVSRVMVTDNCSVIHKTFHGYPIFSNIYQSDILYQIHNEIC